MQVTPSRWLLIVIIVAFLICVGAVSYLRSDSAKRTMWYRYLEQ
jgi:uncharacterized membrane protein